MKSAIVVVSAVALILMATVPARTVMAQEKAAEGVAPAATAPAAETKEMKTAFDNKEAVEGWKITGEAAVDMEKNREGEGSGALKLAPGSKAVWKFRDDDGSGKVELWVFDDGTAPEDPKVNRAGPRWGLVSAGGNVVSVGVIYAKYLSGNETYAFSDAAGGKSFIAKVQYSAIKRTPGWRKWTFDFDAEKGLQILVDGTNVNAKKQRFDWTKTHLAGFNALALYGDAGKGNEQTFWVDDVTVTLGGPVKAKLPEPEEAKPAEKPAPPAGEKKAE